MESVLASLREYIVLVAKAWWQLAIGVLAAGYAVATHFDSALSIPGWTAVIVAVVALSVAQFQAFHQVRRAAEFASPEAQFRSLPGIRNELSGGTYWPNQLGAILAYDEKGLVVRVVLAPRNPLPGIQVDSTLIGILRETLDRSPLEHWLASRTGTGASWQVQSPSTHYVTTIARAAANDVRGGAALSGLCRCQIPVGPQSPRAVLFLDVVVHPATEDGILSSYRLSRPEIYELCHVLIATVLDVIAPRVFPRVTAHAHRLPFSKPPPPVGPSIYLLANAQTNLGDFIELADLARVPGAQADHVHTMAAIETPFDGRLDSFAARDTLIKDGLKTILLANEFLAADTTIDALQLPPAQLVQNTTRRSRLRRP